jgi:hypothetical protein
MALTGSRSPSPAMILAVNFCTNAGAAAGTAGGISMVLLTLAGTFISCKLSRLASTAA